MASWYTLLATLYLQQMHTHLMSKACPNPGYSYLDQSHILLSFSSFNLTEWYLQFLQSEACCWSCRGLKRKKIQLLSTQKTCDGLKVSWNCGWESSERWWHTDGHTHRGQEGTEEMTHTHTHTDAKRSVGKRQVNVCSFVCPPTCRVNTTVSIRDKREHVRRCTDLLH